MALVLSASILDHAPIELVSLQAGRKIRNCQLLDVFKLSSYVRSYYTAASAGASLRHRIEESASYLKGSGKYDNRAQT